MCVAGKSGPTAAARCGRGASVARVPGGTDPSSAQRRRAWRAAPRSLHSRHGDTAGALLFPIGPRAAAAPLAASRRQRRHAPVRRGQRGGCAFARADTPAGADRRVDGRWGPTDGTSTASTRGVADRRAATAGRHCGGASRGSHSGRDDRHSRWALPMVGRATAGQARRIRGATGEGARPHLPHMHAEHHEQNHAVPLFLLPGRAQQPTAATTSAWQGAHTGYRPDVPVGAASRPLPPPAPPPAATGKRPPPFCHTQLPPTVSSPSPRAVPTASHRPQASAIAAAGPPAHRRCADPLTLAARGRPRRALLLGSPKPQLGLPVRRPRRRRRHFPVAGQAAPTVPRVAARHVCMAAGHTARRLATRRWPVRRLPRPAGSIPPTHSAALGPGPLALRPSAACRRRASPPPVATAAAADRLPGPPRLLCPVLTGSVWPAAGCAASDCSWAPWTSHREDVKGDSAACQHCSLPEGTLTTCYARCLVGYLLRGPRPAWVTFTKEAVVSTP